MAIEKNSFIEIEFSARVKDGEIFDTTRKEEAKALGIKEEEVKPLIISVGNEMVVSGLDKDLIGKESGKEYHLEIKSEEAFGKRDPTLIQMVPITNFLEQRINPQRGMQFSLDGRLAKILSVSGGRVMVDFNNALAGKDIVYDYKINRIIKDKKEQLDALQDFFFRRKFDSEISEKKIVVKVEKEFSPLFDLMRKKFGDMLGREVGMEILKKADEVKKT